MFDFFNLRKNIREFKYGRGIINFKNLKEIFDKVQSRTSIKDFVTGTGSFLTSLPAGEDSGK